jgi:hypothetical protein
VAYLTSHGLGLCSKTLIYFLFFVDGAELAEATLVSNRRETCDDGA